MRPGWKAALIAASMLLPLPSCGDERDPNEAPGAFEWDRYHHDPAIRTLQEFISRRSALEPGPGGIDVDRADWREHLPAPPEVDFTDDRFYRWVLETNRGIIRFRLLAGAAPRHVANVMYLTLLGYYDGLAFHGGQQGHLIRGGYPRGDGSGGPGYELPREVARVARHEYRGCLGARGREAGGFYVTFKPRPWLDGKFTVFGELDGGKDALEAFEKLCPTDEGPLGEPIVIEKAYIYMS